jgi:hypothetical protein
LIRRESVSDDSPVPTQLDPATLPRDVTALRSLLLQREDEHAAELHAAHNGLKEQVLRNEQLKLRLAKLLRERFGASSEKLRGAIEQLELILGDLDEQVAQTTPPEPGEPAAPNDNEPPRRKPARKPLPETLPREVVEHAAPLSLSQLRRLAPPARLGEDVTEVLDYVPGAFRVTRHVQLASERRIDVKAAEHHTPRYAEPTAAAAANQEGRGARRGRTLPRPCGVGVGGELRLVAFKLVPADVALVMILQQDLAVPKRAVVPVGFTRLAINDLGSMKAFAVGVGAGIERVLQHRDDIAVADWRPIERRHPLAV